LRILFAAPAYWPATAFGGPVRKTHELAQGLVARGHEVEVVTTSMTSLHERPARSSRTENVDGAMVHYLGTPLRYRWIGIVPSLGRLLNRIDRPDAVHVFGFRDHVGTRTARWARQHRIPYVFEGDGMIRPKLHKVVLKSALDRTAYRSVVPGASVCVANSDLERNEYVEAGADPSRVVVRPNGFPPLADPGPRPGALRRRIGLDGSVPLVLSLGRVGPNKGIDWAIRALPELEGAHLAIVGPDERGTSATLVSLARDLQVEKRVHVVGPWLWPAALELYGDADVFVLPSAYESFGMAAAEAAAAGTVPVVTDRCGVADLLRHGGGVVIPYDESSLREELARVLADPELRAGLATGARKVAAEWSWSRIVELQEEIYGRAIEGG
jgi:glycosyltransferase involved in cell wall biosynthesis